MSSKKVLIAIRSFAEFNKEPLKKLKEEGFELIENKTGNRLDENTLKKLIWDVDGVIAGTEKYTREVLSKAYKLKVISRVGVGIDNIDVEFAKSKGIKITITPEPTTIAVAEHTISLMLSLLKNIPTYDRRCRSSDFKPMTGFLLQGKTIGIVGLGRIGKKVGELVSCLGCKIIGYDPYMTDETFRFPIKRVSSLEELLKSSDIVTLHVSYSPENENMINEDTISKMKKGAFIINTARGKLIDEDALYLALKSGHLAGAALDVFREEPYSGPLLELDNVVFTPHISSNVKEARYMMEMEAVKNLINSL